MRQTVRILSAAIVGLFLAATAFAQAGTQQQKTMDQKQQQNIQQKQAGEQDLISSDWLTGKTVFSSQADELGTITDLVLDQRTGKVGYVVVSTGGFFDLSDEKHLVPYKSLNITQDRVTLDMDRQKFSQAPQWQQGLTMQDFERRSAEFFGVSPVWGEKEGPSEREGIIKDKKL